MVTVRPKRGGKVNNRVALEYVDSSNRIHQTSTPRITAPPKVPHAFFIIIPLARRDLTYLTFPEQSTLSTLYPSTISFKMATTTEEKPVGMFTSCHQCAKIATYIIVQTTLSPTPTRELPSDLPCPSERATSLTQYTASPSTRLPPPSPRRS